ncbi:ABC transporter substrate-binding protein [Serinibacter arcticus]|uniref:ABC transporter substrate-binding protein n=1 Tax=Serinibacter arcticus TaxID=1655435 RepID=A0A2U1ZXX6_9MICO|nr:extracellular solute-binding protein [Serinibacter arcticus]PWD51814.1 ABC transporter substrate-binding protein [Serinibacter arcticus]
MSRNARAPQVVRGRAAAAASVVAALSLVLAACSGGGDDGSDGEDPADGSPAELTIMVIKHPLTKPMAEMGWVSQLEERANVSITWEEVAADWDQKKNPMLAAGDVPDLIIGNNAITDADLSTFGSLFEDLSDDLDALPNVQALFEEVDGAESLATQTSGEVFSIPSYKRFWPTAITHQYINQQWLDTLGLEQPTTWDELFDVLVAFKEGDPNGNGQADEIPMDFAPVGTTGFGYFNPSALLGSTGLPISGGGGEGYFLEDGEVKNFFTDERYRDTVEFLHRCWEAGLISNEAFTQDYSTYQSVARGTGDEARVGFSWGWSGSDRFGPGVYEQYEAVAPLLAEEGQSAPVRWSYDFENLTRNAITMAADTRSKDAALRVINEFYSPDMSIQVLFGDIGPNVEQVSDTEFTVLPPADENLDPSTWKWTSSIADNGPIYLREDMEVELPTDLAEAVEDALPLEVAFEDFDVDTNVYPSLFIHMSQADISSTALNNTGILGVAMPKFAEFVTTGGATDQWDTYVSQIEGLGVQQNIDIMQTYYDEYMASK